LQFGYIGILTPALYNSIQSGTLQDAPEDIGAVPGIHDHKKHLCCPVKVPFRAASRNLFFRSEVAQNQNPKKTRADFRNGQ
jgi:hypothetical protein